MRNFLPLALDIDGYTTVVRGDNPNLVFFWGEGGKKRRWGGEFDYHSVLPLSQEMEITKLRGKMYVIRYRIFEEQLLMCWGRVNIESLYNTHFS